MGTNTHTFCADVRIIAYFSTSKHTHRLMGQHKSCARVDTSTAGSMCRHNAHTQRHPHVHMQPHRAMDVLTHTHTHTHMNRDTGMHTLLVHTQTHSRTQTHGLHAGWLWLSCNRWRGYCPRPACAHSPWQQAPASQHLGSPGAPGANLTPTRNTKPGTLAVNPAIGAVPPAEWRPSSEQRSTLIGRACFILTFMNWQMGSYFTTTWI